MLRRRVSLRVRFGDLRAMLRFGLPTVPADASVYALQVVDRFYLFRGYSHAAAGDYAVALQLATVVFVAVRGFQYAWPPLAYSIDCDAEASRLYALVTTYYVLATGAVVVAVALLARWIVRLLAAPQYFDAHTRAAVAGARLDALGLYLVIIVITGRARATGRNLPAAARGARGEHRAAAVARPRERPAPGDRRRGHRAVRRLCRDARRHAPAHARPVRASRSSGAGWPS